ncbi:MAG: metallophosphoesterase family protein [Candidatus Lindowbacteria bacterium]|nr:metallophosphoesterase family protein [Candidatus Lindowbacteria bacterium]
MLTAFIILIIALSALVVYAYFIETRRFRATCVRMKAARNFGGKLKILHISDFHFKKGDEAKLAFLRNLHSTPVDMVVVAGDMIEADSGISYCVEALRGFRASVGVFAVFGAHDRWDTRFWNVVLDLSIGGYRRGQPNDFDRLKCELEKIGVVCLENESRRITLPESLGAEEMWMVGVGDLFAGLGDFRKALEGVPHASFRILITHAIEHPEQMAAYKFDAVFAGHSHGGQVRLPFVGALYTRSSLHRSFASGMFEIAGTPFHINNGIGAGRWTEFRFLCPPEATYVELSGERSES